MFVDFVFPRSNEQYLIKAARVVKTRGLCFVYRFKDVFSVDENRISPDFIKNKGKSLLSLKDSLIKENSDFVFYFALSFGSLDEYNKYFVFLKKLGLFNLFAYDSFKDLRFFVEKSKVDMFYNIELSKDYDFNFQRNSGMDHVITRFLAEKQKVYGVNFNSLIKSSNFYNRSRILGRMEQNVRLCNKYGAKVVVFSGASYPWEIRSYSALRSFANLFEVSDEFKSSMFSLLLSDYK